MVSKSTGSFFSSFSLSEIKRSILGLFITTPSVKSYAIRWISLSGYFALKLLAITDAIKTSPIRLFWIISTFFIQLNLLQSNTFFLLLRQNYPMPLNIYTHPDYASQKDLILNLVQQFHNEGEMLVKGSRNIIKTNFLGDEKVNLKYFKRPNAMNSVVYSLLRPSKARRSFEYAQYLLQHQILT